jgi:hypothetical protein
MIEKVSLEIKAPLEKVLNFFAESEQGYATHYKDVSPDHIERVVNVKNLDFANPDVSFQFKQHSPITGRVQKIRGKVTKAELDKTTGVYRFETKFLFPTSLIMPGYHSVIEPKGERSILTIYLHFTFLAKFMEKSRQKVVAHITEELETSKSLIEG